MSGVAKPDRLGQDLSIDRSARPESGIQVIPETVVRERRRSVRERLDNVLGTKPSRVKASHSVFAGKTPTPNKKGQRRRVRKTPLGGGGGDGPKTPENKELLPPPDHILHAQEKLFEREGILVDTPPLHDNITLQQQYRLRLFNESLVGLIYNLQQSGDLKDIENITDFYKASQKAYKGGLIDRRNLEIMDGVDSAEQRHHLLYHDGDPNDPLSIIELACGNAEVARTLKRRRPWARTQAIMYSAHRSVGAPLKAEFMAALRSSANSDPQLSVPQIHAIDIAPHFAAKALQAGLSGQVGNICQSPEDFFESTGLHPNSFDRVHMHNAWDRVKNPKPTMNLMKYLARLDPERLTRFLFGQFFPIKSTTDSMSHDNVPSITCFDSETDMRVKAGWTHPDKATAISQYIAGLNHSGFRVDTLAEQSIYDVYSVHCPIGEPERIKNEYPELEQRDFIDPKLNAIRDRLFAGKLLDSDLYLIKDQKTEKEIQVIAFPQTYPIVLVSGVITKQMDGSRL